MFDLMKQLERIEKGIEDFMKMNRFRRVIALLVALSLVIFLFPGCASDTTTEPAAENPVIGIAWRSDTDSGFYTNIVAAVEEAGAQPVLLDQVVAEYLPYNEAGELVDCADENDIMLLETAELIKENLWEQSNVEEVLEGVDGVIFTGGNDVSPTLMRVPEEWHGIEAEIDYNVTRDASDYILMSYCIEQNMTVMGFCRGMQMIGVVGGASFIQDIPVYFEELGKEYNYEHRNEVEESGVYRDYIAHDVDIVADSLAYEIYQTEVLSGCPSWHHQAVRSVENTDLVITGTADTNGEKIVEIIEYSGKDFVIGCQFHPEAATIKHLEKAEDASDFMDYETSVLIFKAMIDHITEG